jgi:hypothetical protein
MRPSRTAGARTGQYWANLLPLPGSQRPPLKGRIRRREGYPSAERTVMTSKTRNVPNKTDLADSIGETEQRWCAFVEGLSDVDLVRMDPGAEWNVAAIVAHVTAAVAMIPLELETIRAGAAGFYALPHEEVEAFKIGSAVEAARSQSRTDMVGRCHSGVLAALAALAGVGDDEWAEGTDFFDEGFWNVERIFRNVARHADVHISHINAILGRS